VADPRKVITKADLVAATNGLTISTLLTASEPDKKLFVSQKGNGKGKTKIQVDGAGRDEDVLAFDLTFTGTWNNTPTGIIVHAIGESLLRPNCTGCGGGNGGQDQPDGQYQKPGGKPVSVADLTDCQKLLDAAGISYDGSTVVSAVWGAGVSDSQRRQGRPAKPNGAHARAVLMLRRPEQCGQSAARHGTHL
jgi:hypothetical protein